jgi:hypothetical protein
MKSFALYAFVAVATLTFVACRQADGPLPTPDAEEQNRLEDLKHDLLNVAGAQPDAAEDLSHDLRVFAWSPQAATGSDQLSARVSSVLPGTRLSDQTAAQLALSCWMAVAARQMSERQVDSLKADIENVLTSIGVTEQNARTVSAEVGKVQELVTARPRRWYEIF